MASFTDFFFFLLP